MELSGLHCRGGQSHHDSPGWGHQPTGDVRSRVRVQIRVRLRVRFRVAIRVRVRVRVGGLLPDLTLHFLYHV